MCKTGIYLVCDYPDKDKFFEAVEVCENNGVDFLEIGLPFSDPVADGPVIESASLEVLKKENTDDFLSSLKKVREIFSKKLYVMTYSNVIFGYGIEKFAKRVDFVNGLIIADLAFVERGIFKGVFKNYGVNIVHFVTPETDFGYIDKIKSESDDFIYFVSTRGITGGRFSLDKDTLLRVEYTKKGFEKGVILGFGIRNKDDIKKACEYADGVVIGTQAVESLKKGVFEDFVKALR